MNKLAVLDKKMPLRAYPEQDLNRIILTDFLTWLSNILSLTDEVSAKRLEISLPALKEHCWGMGFDEVKKMFEMYVDGKLSVKPLPNYFDRILFGKIVNAYNQQKPKKKIMAPETVKKSDSETEKLFFEVLADEFKEFKKLGKVNNLRNWLYDEIVKRGVTVEDVPKSVAWKHSVKEIKEAQKFVDHRDRLNDADLKVQAITLYKQKLIEIIFKRYIDVTQLINDLK